MVLFGVVWSTKSKPSIASTSATHPGSWKLASQRFSICSGLPQVMEWSVQHPYPTTRNRTREQGGKRGPTHKRFIIWTCQQKRAVWSEHGKVHQIWMCYTNPFTAAETWAGFEVSHSYPFGPIWLCHCSQTVWRCMRSWAGRGENYLFIAPVALACWLSGSFLPRRAVSSTSHRPWAQRLHTFYVLCPSHLIQHSSRQPAQWGCEAPPASRLIPQLWLLLTGHNTGRGI